MDFFNFNYISTLCNEANHANTKQSIDIPLCFQEYVIKAIVDHVYYNIDNYNSKIIPIMKVTQSYDQWECIHLNIQIHYTVLQLTYINSAYNRIKRTKNEVYFNKFFMNLRNQSSWSIGLYTNVHYKSKEEMIDSFCIETNLG